MSGLETILFLIAWFGVIAALWWFYNREGG